MTKDKLEKAIATYYNYLLNTNADFKKFVEANKNKSTEQMIKDNNINESDYIKVYNAINKYFVEFVKRQKEPYINTKYKHKLYI